MHGMEIHTGPQYRLPVTFLLFDNHAHAMCVTREQLFYGDLYSYNRFGPSRLGAGLATMFPGCRRSTSNTSMSCPRRCGPHSMPTALRSSASSAQPMKFRHSQAFSASPSNIPFQRRTALMTLPALDDITAHTGTADPIE